MIWDTDFMTGENKKEQELRLKVAELCGWIFIAQGVYVRTYPPGTPQSQIGNLEGMPEGALLIKSELPNARELACTYNAPNYPKDLNAMHEAEKILPQNNSLAGQTVYDNRLYKLCGTVNKSIHATARQRAEAFVLALTGKASEADSVSSTKPAESASVIPQIPVFVDLESEWTVRDDGSQGYAVVDTMAGAIALGFHYEDAIRVCSAHNDSLRQLRSSLLQHEGVITQQSSALSELLHFARNCGTSDYAMLDRAHTAVSLQPTDSLLAEYVESKVKEALEKQEAEAK